MLNIRRVYMYLISAISLNAVAWALIALLRNLLTPGLNQLRGGINYNLTTVALQLAVIIIGLPIFLAHWIWSQRLAQREEEEQLAPLRLIYLYVMLTAFLAPFIANAYAFLKSGFRLLLNFDLPIPTYSSVLPDNANLVYALVAMVVLAMLWAYHFGIVRATRQKLPDPQFLDTLNRLYIYIFTFIGLILAGTGVGNLLRWLLFRIGDSINIVNAGVLAAALAQLAVGVPLWIIFWRQAENLFQQGDEAEQISILRKFYLYLVIFLAALGTVGSLTALFAGLLRRLLALESQGDVRNVLCVLIPMAVIWAYHFIVLQQDARVLPEEQQQAGVRRLYWYLIAGIGLMALLVGVGGDISVLIRSQFTQPTYIQDLLPEQFAWFTAVAIAGLFVWIIPWQKIQKEIVSPEQIGLQARQSMIRKIYLYFYLLIATLTFLGAGIYIVSQILLLILGGRTSHTLGSDMAHALAFGLIAAIVWIYHNSLIRRDNKALAMTSKQATDIVHVAVVDDEDGRFGNQLITALQKALPDIILYPIGLTSDAVTAMENGDERLPITEALKKAEIIVGSWTIATPYVDHGQTDLDSLVAIASSPGHKLLIPRSEEKWDWIGVNEWQMETAVEQTIYSIEQVIARKPVKTAKSYKLGTAIAIGLGIFVIINLVLPIMLFAALALFGFV